MHSRIWFCIVMTVMVGVHGSTTLADLGAPVELKCEYQARPLGLDTPAPRLSWQVTDDRRGAVQTGYQVVVSTDPNMADPAAVVWDTGKVKSDQSIHLAYAGKPLVGGTRYYWKVRTWDMEDRPSDDSKIAWWEMGLLKPEEWSGRWITTAAAQTVEEDLVWGDWIWNKDALGPNKSCFFRLPIDIPAGDKVERAIIKMTVDDSYYLFVNGRKVGENGNWDSVKKYEFADELKAGRNLLAIKATNGPGECGLIATLRVTLAGGKVIDVHSQANWKSTAAEQDNWTAIDFDDSGWGDSTVVAAYEKGPWGKLKENPGPQRSQYFRREFEAKAGITRARIYASGLGIYQLQINGRPVGEDVFSPGWTKYDKRIQYQTYDVTEHIREGKNAVGVMLGNGWFSGGLGWSNVRSEPGGRKLRFIGQLRIDYQDGTQQTIVTDDGWKSHPSPIVADTFYHGETYDARQEVPGWSVAGLADTDWKLVVRTEDPTNVLVAERSEPLRVTQTLTATQISEPAKGVYIYDFEQNAAGRVRLKVSAERGTRIRLRFAEVLNPDGTLYRDNYRSAQATDYYICKGEGNEVWEPAFTYRGFRFCEVTGLPGKPPIDALTCRVLHSAPPMAGDFECSHWLINRIHQAIRWGQRSNMHSVPTDCPQRDERLGWMGDAQMFAPTSCWNMMMANFYAKWMRDITDSQARGGADDGATTDVAPVVVVPGPAKPGWGDAVIVVPWTVYQFYGDTRVIEENYDGMVRWVEYMRRKAKDGLLYEQEGYGDWVPVVASPSKQIGVAYYYYSTKLLSRMAAAIGKTEDADKYRDLADRIAAAFHKAYYDDKTDTYPPGTQTANILPLFFGITPADKRAAVSASLVSDIINREYHLSTGFLGTGYLMPLLTSLGKQDIAYRLATQTSYPSWGYMVLNGASTIWERWNSDKMGPDMNSRNHFALGGVGQWFYEALGGINPDVTHPGFKRIILCPQPAGDLIWMRATYPSPYGKIKVAWERVGQGLAMHVTIPANTSAELHLPTLGLKNVTVTEGDRKVLAYGRSAEPAAGVKLIKSQADSVVFEIGAGEYGFVIMGQ